MHRRTLLKWAAGAAVATLTTHWMIRRHARAHVVVIGGGFAGATAAKYLKIWAPDVAVTLVEPRSQFVSCPQSNLVLSHSRKLSQLTHSYEALRQRYGVAHIQARVAHVDPSRQRIVLDDGSLLPYDRVIMAPGIALDYHLWPELAQASAQQRIPHAWLANGQVEQLRDQIMTMRRGGTVVMTIPPAPYRCPPGPYERVCQIALSLKRHNPRAKVLVLDANPDLVSKGDFFRGVWQRDYPEMIEYVPMSDLEAVDPSSLMVETLFDTYQADVLNVIPRQLAGALAQRTGLVNVDQQWCGVDFLSYESTVVPKIHVIGDATATKLPKSAHVANAQAKICAAAVIALLHDRPPEPEPVFANTCYSFTDDQQAGYVAHVYRHDSSTAEMLPMPGGGVSTAPSVQEGLYAQAWAENIWADTLK